MIHTLLVTGLMAAGASAQARYASDGFKYVGCVQAKACDFPVKMDLGDSFTVAQCQQACGKNGSYAAAGVNGCYCEDSVSRGAPEYEVTDDSSCSKACKSGDDKAGRCGGPSPADGEQLYNLYQRIPAAPTVPNVTTTRLADKPAAAAGDATPAALKTIATHPAEAASTPRTGADEPHAASFREPTPSAAESRGVAYSNDTAPAPPAPATTAYQQEESKPSASPPSGPCRGRECPEAEEVPSQFSTKFAPGTTANNNPSSPSHSVIVSEGPSRPASVITVALGMAALVLAMGMS
ncbi:Carbohydrate-binding WSC [Metarhizium brunneum]